MASQIPDLKETGKQLLDTLEKAMAEESMVYTFKTKNTDKETKEDVHEENKEAKNIRRRCQEDG